VGIDRQYVYQWEYSDFISFPLLGEKRNIISSMLYPGSGYCKVTFIV
jgi:hypothetical protein